MLRRFIAGAAALVAAAALAAANPAQAAAPTAKPGTPVTKPLVRSGGGMSKLLANQYQYAASGQSGIAAGYDGTRATMTVDKPYLDSNDYHSLMEGVVIKRIVPSSGGAAQRNMVEIGWTVDRAVNGGSVEPHLFGFAWKNGQPLGYNAAGGFIDAAGCATNLGQSLAADVGTQKGFIIQYKSAAPAGWYLWHGNSAFTTGCWMGYWPITIWTTSAIGGVTVSGFTNPEEIQWFGEVALESTGPMCSDMGDGTMGSTASFPFAQASDPSWVSSVRLTNAGTLTNANLTDWSTDPAAYDTFKYSATTVLLGGYGRNNAGGTPGTTGSC